MSAKPFLSAEYWNDVYASYPRHFRSRVVANYHETEQVALLERWLPRGCQRVLFTDLFNESFGYTTSLNWCIGHSRHVVGMDIASKVVRRLAAEASAGFSKVVCDARNLPFEDGSFECVVSFSTLDHFSRHHFEQSLREIYRVLAKGGILVLTLHNATNIFLYFYFMKLIFKFPIETYSLKRASGIIAGCKFQVTDKDAIAHVLFPGITNGIFQFFEKLGFSTALRRDYGDFCRRLGKLQTKYLTAKFIALCAVKS